MPIRYYSAALVGQRRQRLPESCSCLNRLRDPRRATFLYQPHSGGGDRMESGADANSPPLVVSGTGLANLKTHDHENRITPFPKRDQTQLKPVLNGTSFPQTNSG
jgi:hypothetical protein